MLKESLPNWFCHLFLICYCLQGAYLGYVNCNQTFIFGTWIEDDHGVVILWMPLVS